MTRTLFSTAIPAHHELIADLSSLQGDLIHTAAAFFKFDTASTTFPAISSFENPRSVISSSRGFALNKLRSAFRDAEFSSAGHTEAALTSVAETHSDMELGKAGLDAIVRIRQSPREI